MATAIPVMRIGHKPFHEAADDTEAEYERLRGLAHAEGEKRNGSFAQSKQAYSQHDGQRAKELSEAGKQHAEAMRRLNAQAAELVFRANNGPGRVAADEIDLHGLLVEEAVDALAARIRADVAAGQSHLHAIVGRGIHSADHLQHIKPAAEQLCAEMGLRCSTEHNAGRIYIDLRGESGPPLPQPAYQQQPEYQPQSGYQPPSGYQPQSGQGPAAGEQDPLSRLVGRLQEVCCVVM